MRTPAGKECPHYYQDAHRGHTLQECRLLDRSPNSLPWEPGVCALCAVPDILRANGCPHMHLEARLVRRFLRRRVEVAAYCTAQEQPIANPYVGCGYCHPNAAAVLHGKDIP